MSERRLRSPSLPCDTAGSPASEEWVGQIRVRAFRSGRRNTVKQVWPCHPARLRHKCFIVVVCVGWMLWIGGCKEPVVTSPSQGQITRADHPQPAARQSPKPPEQAPLLLEDEPAGAASTTPAADNSRCFVCHANYMQEEIAVTHAKANIGCAHCHGASDAHIADESWALRRKRHRAGAHVPQGQDQSLLPALSSQGQDRHAAARGGPGRHRRQAGLYGLPRQPSPAPTPLQVEVARL